MWPLRAHHWIAARSTQLGPIADVVTIFGVLAARGSDGHPDQWRGSSNALAGWALAVEAGVGSECLWGLLITSAVAIAVSRLFTSTPRGVLVGDTLRAFLTAAFYAITPALWMISRPACSDESADVKIGS